MIALTGSAIAAEAPTVPLSVPLADGAVQIEGEVTPITALTWTDDALWTAHGGGLLSWAIDSGQPSPVHLDGASTSGAVLASGPRGALMGAGDDGAWHRDASGRVTPLAGHDAPISAVHWSPDGRWVLTADASGRALLWDSETGGQRWIAALGGAITAAKWSPDGRRIALSTDGALTVLDAASGVDRGALEPSEIEAAARWSEAPEDDKRRDRHRRRAAESAAVAAWSPDGERLLLGEADGSARIVSESGRSAPSLALDGHPGAVVSVTISEDGAWIASGGADGVIRVRDGRTRALVARLEGPAGSCAALSFRGDVLAAGGSDGTIRGWDITTGEQAWALESGGPVNDLAYSAGGGQLAAGLANGGGVWDAETRALAYALGDAGVQTLSWSPGGDQLAALSIDAVQIWSGSGAIAHTLTPPAAATTLDWSDAGLASAGQSVQLWRIDADGPEALCALVAAPGGAWAAFDAAGRFDDGNGAGAIAWSLSGESVQLDQLRSYYFEPGLMGLHLSGAPLVSARPLSELKLYPEVTVTPPEAGAWPVYLIAVSDRGGGIGTVEARLNGSDISGFLTPASDYGGERTYRLDVSNIRFYDPSGDNELKVWAYDARDGLSSPRGVATRSARAASDDAPREPLAFWGIFVGAHDYRGEALDLTFPANDARALHDTMGLAATTEIYRRGVNLRLLTTDSEDPADLPTRANLEAAFAALKEARPQDVVMLYMAGHGMTYAGEYYYPTSEFGDHESLDDPIARGERAVSGEELQSWLLESGAGKRTMILDTCEAGGVGEEDEGGDAVALAGRSADVTRAQALEDLYDRTGVFVLAGASEGKRSYEASRYGHGVLSYALLQGLRGPGLVDGDLVDIGQLFLHVQRQVPELARGIGGVQEPEVKLPKGGSVVIGRLPQAQIDRIELRDALPVLLPAEFSRPRDDSDPLQLTEVMNSRLEQLTYDQSASAVFVNFSDLPNAYRLQGRYAIDAAEVTAVARLLYKESVVQEGAAVAGFKLTVEAPADADEMADALDRAVQKWLRRGGQSVTDSTDTMERTQDGVLILNAEEAARQYELLAHPDELTGRHPEGCDKDDTLTRTGDLSQALGWSRLSFSQGQELFDASLERLDLSLSCLTDPMEQQDARLMHRIHGLAAWDGGAVDPVPYLKSSEPRSSEFTTRDASGDDRDEYAVLVENQIAIELWKPGAELELPPSARGRVRVDGQYTREAAADLPYVFQRVGRTGRVLESGYIHPGDPLPDYPRLRKRLAILGTASTVAAAALYAGGYYTHCEVGWTDTNGGDLCSKDWKLPVESTNQLALTQQQRVNRVLVGGAIGASALGASSFVGLGVSYAY